MRVVVALGGNALGDTPQEQIELVKNTAQSIVQLVDENYEIVLVHGNGPQVGMINKEMSDVEMPFPECGAMSQGYIGYHLQNAVRNELLNRKIEKDVVTLVTQVEVDEGDPGFKNPTKPIGEFLSYRDAKVLVKQKGYTMIEDSGRGYRRAVPSPKPVDIVEKKTVLDLLEKNTVVIVGGGGGIPVIKTNEGYKGVPAVIDKDSTAAKIADIIDADTFIILTAVPTVMINFGKSNQKEISKMNIAEAREHIKDGQFPEGSMLPKVLAAINFVESKPNSQTLIASLEEVSLALKGKTGTIIYK